MIDVITIISEETPKHWVGESIRSVKVAADFADGVNIIHSDGVKNHIGKAVSNSLKKSTAEYICFVDDDDMVLPNAFRVMEKHIPNQPSTVFAREFHLLSNGRIRIPNRRHHLAMYHRDILSSISFEEHAVNIPVLMIEAAEKEEDVYDEMSWVYIYRIYRSKAMAIRSMQKIDK